MSRKTTEMGLTMVLSGIAVVTVIGLLASRIGGIKGKIEETAAHTLGDRAEALSVFLSAPFALFVLTVIGGACLLARHLEDRDDHAR